MSNNALNSLIDHTNLKPDAMQKDIVKLAQEAMEYHFFSVCVNPTYVPTCKQLLHNCAVKVCTVVGFPLGANQTATKVLETEIALSEGAQEIDMVINIGALKNGDISKVKDDMAQILEKCHQTQALLKVILETGLLTEDEITQASTWAMEVGAHFVKTSTGFGPRGASVRDIELMSQAVQGKLGIKASGGIKTTSFAQQLVAAGATRLGASASIALVGGN